MAEKTGIAWTDATWNPWRGCTKVSEGCDHCYMYREQRRYSMEPSEVVKAAGRTFNLPMRLKPGTKVFVCSWSDFFHEAADQWRRAAWDIIRERPDLIFQLCTKRIERVESVLPNDWPFSNVWLGVTAENQRRWNERVAKLMQIDCLGKRFVSCEPLLEGIDADFCDAGQAIGPCDECGESKSNPKCEACDGLPSIDWIIIGGESGPKARPMFEGWARDLRDQCKDAGIAFFMKQLGGWPNKRDKMSDFPKDLQIREFPGGK